MKHPQIKIRHTNDKKSDREGRSFWYVSYCYERYAVLLSENGRIAIGGNFRTLLCSLEEGTNVASGSNLNYGTFQVDFE